MLIHPDKVYKDMMEDIHQLHAKEGPDEKIILETAFGICVYASDQLRKWIMEYKFASVAEEINFFKLMKPKITSRMEYYKKRYQAALFLPEKKPDQLRFWEYELDKIERFFSDNAAFYTYCKSQSQELDHFYFLRDCPIGAAGDHPCHWETGYDELLGMIGGLERYKRFVQTTLENINNAKLS